MDDSIGLITDIQTRLAGQRCPFCAQGNLDLVLRCDVHADGCLFLVRCEFCQMQYSIDRSTVPFHAATGLPPGSLTQVTCPQCGSTNCRVTFRCTVPSRRCAYEVDCAVCHHSNGL